MGHVTCKEKNCRYRRKRKKTPYGSSSSKTETWHCRCDRLASHENVAKTNSKRERRKAKKKIKEEIESGS